MAIKVNRADMAADHSAREAWRLFGIMSEFVEATERLEPLRPVTGLILVRKPRLDGAVAGRT